MNAFFLDNFINQKELNHLAKEVKREQLLKTIQAMKKFNEMQTRIIREKQIDISLIRKKRFF